jgi:probable rRNA maturation factor
MNITIINKNKEFNINKKNIKQLVEIILEKELLQKTNFELSLMFCDDEEMKKKNKQYLNEDKYTDVLSFPMDDNNENLLEKVYLGDILVSSERAFKRAEEFNNSFQQEFILYIIHGILHLLGYDDIQEQDRKIMRKKEQEYLNILEFGTGEIISVI